MPGMGYPENIVKAPKQNGALVICPVREYTKKLFLQGLVVDAVVLVKAGLRAPANMECRVNMGLAPLHDLAKLLPIIHFFKG